MSRHTHLPDYENCRPSSSIPDLAQHTDVQKLKDSTDEKRRSRLSGLPDYENCKSKTNSSRQTDKRYNKQDRKSTRLNSSHVKRSRMPSSA